MLKSKLIVVSGPSGSGKTTVCRGLLKKIPGLQRSISYTTRPKRPGEKNGKDYFFISRNDFENRIKENRFLEYAVVFGNYYGTDKDWVLSQKTNILLSIDVQGAAQIKKNYPNSVLLFLMPPTMKALEERLKIRATDKQDEISKRLDKAKEEIAQAPNYNYTIINDKIEETVERIKAIIGSKYDKG